MARMNKLRLIALGAAICIGWIGMGGEGAGLKGLHQLASPPAASVASAAQAPSIGEPELLDALKQAAVLAAEKKSGNPGLQTEGLQEDSSGALDSKAGNTAQLVSSKPEEKKPSAEDKTVYLTFDDGPSVHTSDVLDILRKYGVKATFFMVGKNVKEQSKRVNRVQEEGHAIGNHSYNHVYKDIYSSFAGYARQTLLTEQALLDAGVATNLVRAPGGTFTNFDAGYFKAMKAAGYTMVDWNVDSGDSRRVGVPAKEIIAGATSAPFKREMTVLIHDGTGHAESVKALPAIIEFYKAKGYRFAVITSKVKSPVFPVAKKMKWKREAPQAAEITALAEKSNQLRSSKAWLAAASNGVGEGAVLPAIGKGAETVNPPVKPKTYGTLQADLLLQSGYGEVRIGYGEYFVVDGKLTVPVRRTVEALGGGVIWNAPEGTASIIGYSGIGSLNRDTAFLNGEGRLYAPLSEVLELMEDSLTRIEVSPGLAEAWLGSGAAAEDG
ncbi:polysaccharide deacetylase [Paenibacillus herberti]|uniref:NodB homology domain-containing protein n=1 Tax=Paenibacillus herberti TaxID=1619309 RepID=A0A229NVV3_9BACL|nr:polysaccharide deacetylase [Paenibacillus herberti]OXM13990.1 hypothetical protein CGZ75_13375 [Paenibacillus herberti]